MNILGIGVDLVEVERITAAVARHGPPFLKRIFTDREIEFCGVRNERLAARFAAKEAVAKAFGTGIGAAMAFTEIEVVNEESGRPGIVLHGAAAATAAARRVSAIHLSLSHTHSHAIAQVVIVGADV
jgi:holo-[acyl-carrier protein] synthase